MSIKTTIPEKISNVKEGEGNYAVSEEDYKKLQEFKTYQKQRDKINLEYQREKSLKYLDWQIKCAERDINFKKEQIENNEILETVSRKDPQSGVINGFVGGLKPKWFLENEIDKLEMDIEDFKERIKQINIAKEEKDVFAD